MKKMILVLFALLAISSVSFAEENQNTKFKGSLYLSTGTSDLKVKAISGKDSFKNDGMYFGGYGEIAITEKFGLVASFLTGESKDISDASVMTPLSFDKGATVLKDEHGQPVYVPANDKFNPMNKESIAMTDFSVSMNMVDSPLLGKIDATIGYFKLVAKPNDFNVVSGGTTATAIISPAKDGKLFSPENRYTGFSVGLNGCYEFSGLFPETPLSTLGVVYRVIYVPTFEVGGAMKGKLDAKDVLQYRLGLEYTLPMLPQVGFSLGYNSMTLNGDVVYPYLMDTTLFHSDAQVVFTSMYFGMLTKF